MYCPKLAGKLRSLHCLDTHYPYLSLTLNSIDNHAVLFFYTDLTMSVLGSESGLMSSFLSSEEIGELLDKVQNMFVFTFYKCVDPDYLPVLPSTFQNTQY